VRELRRVRPRNALPSAGVFPAAVTNTARKKDFQRASIILKTDNGHAHLHALRHTFGTRLAQRGVALAKLQRLMRHAKVQLTMAFYVHLDVDALSNGLLTLPDVETPSRLQTSRLPATPCESTGGGARDGEP
jgi:integrase